MCEDQSSRWGLYLDEVSDPKLRTLPKYAIGDRVRVAKITLTKNDASDTKRAFLTALGQILTIDEIMLWKAVETPYIVSYQVDVSHLTGDNESIFLLDDEIEPIGSGESNGENSVV